MRNYSVMLCQTYNVIFRSFGQSHFRSFSFSIFFPHATIHGHNEFSAKACPCFDVKKELAPYFDKGRTPFSYSLLILCFSMRCGCFYRNPSDAAPKLFRQVFPEAIWNETGWVYGTKIVIWVIYSLFWLVFERKIVILQTKVKLFNFW